MVSREHYRRLNRTALGVIAFCLVLSFLLRLVGELIPWLPTRCASMAWLGRPCPLCGLTRGVGSLLCGRLGEAQAWNPLSLPLFAMLAAEVVGRIAALRRPPDGPALERITRIDLRMHVTLAVLYLLYCAWFYVAGSGGRWI